MRLETLSQKMHGVGTGEFWEVVTKKTDGQNGAPDRT